MESPFAQQGRDGHFLCALKLFLYPGILTHTQAEEEGKVKKKKKSQGRLKNHNSLIKIAHV